MCFFIPAHLYKNLLTHGTEEQKGIATQALSGIQQFLYDTGAVLADISNPFKKEVEEEVVNRSIYDAERRMELPGKLVRKEGDASKNDIGVDEAYDGSGKTHEFFQKFYGRNSIDNNGMELISTVHFGRNFGNAFWNGSQMTYGDGDGQIFNRFTSVIDVIGHEISHGITERTAGLVYRNQSGALNESWSDVFGSLIKQYSLNHTAEQADWLIGQNLFTDKVNARALRDMKNPGTAYDDPRIGKDPQPNHMKKYVKTTQDQGGVHINSGIPNRAFYTASVNLGGYAWEKAGKIWYHTLCKELNSRSNFQDACNKTVKVAGKLYGDKSVEQKAVIDGWEMVGIKFKKGIFG